MEILTANELLSGAVVYLDQNGDWHQDLERARRFDKGDEEERDALIAKAKATGRLVGVETEIIKIENGQLVPERLRTKIRAMGPTAPYGPEKQDLGEDGHVSI